MRSRPLPRHWRHRGRVALPLHDLPAERRSSPQGVRTFCPACGTALIREEVRPRSVDVTAGSLDAPERVTPRDHTFVRASRGMAARAGRQI